MSNEDIKMNFKSSNGQNGIDLSKPKRATWNNQLDFFLSLVGYAIGLGNIWRFPYLCIKNGGGTFLIPYFLLLFLCAMPLYFLELIIGQFSRLSPVSIWIISPLFQGLGISMVMVSGIVCLYYNVIMAWSLYYMVHSFTLGSLPWSTCDNWWNTEMCVVRKMRYDFENSTNLYVEESYYTNISNDFVSNRSLSLLELGNNETNITMEIIKKSTPAEEFWNYKVLQISSGIDDLGSVCWPLFICLLVAWITVFLCLFKGIHTLGKVVYVTAILPYVMLLVLLIRGCTLPGALEGIKYYLSPDFSKLSQFSVWCEACAQIFYSLGMAYGGLITMSSYNDFNHNCYRTAVLVPIINSGTSFLSGFVVFSILGYMAYMIGVDVSEVTASGPGLAFIVYPEALSLLPGSNMWSVLFFLMLFTVGLDTQFGTFETLISGIVDEFPSVFQGWKKTILTGCVCMLQFILGIPLVTQGGVYVFQIFDWYSATFALITIAFCECVVLAWIYGTDNIYAAFQLMLDRQLCVWWKICWKFISPVALFIVLIFTITAFSQPTYGDYVYPWWAIVMGWCLALCSLVPIPVCMVIALARSEGNLWQRIKKQSLSAKNWGPFLKKNRENLQYKTEESMPMQSFHFQNESILK